MTFEEFILLHENDDPAALLLARHRYPDIDIDLAATTLEGRRRLRKKVPSWNAVPSLLYPSRLAAEQCSSEETALRKATLARSLTAGPRIADLTGGMGVDSWAFSQVFGEVLYNEMNPELARATEENFGKLGVTNVQFRCKELVAGDSTDKPWNDGKSSLPANAGNLKEILGDFQPDLIFMDPARRAEDGRKVFRLADCQPDVLTLLPELMDACPDLLLKLSPMADITQLSRELPGLKAVTVVGAAGECKELLLHLRRGYEGSFSLTVCENGTALAFDPATRLQPEVAERAFSCKREEENSHFPENSRRVCSQTLAEAGFCANAQTAAENLLFEPGKALAKAGVFKELERRYGLQALGASSHLYTGASIPEELLPFGKVFTIEDVLPLCKETFRALKKRIPAAEITARGIPMSSDELRRRLGMASGGTHHLFGVHADHEGNLLLVCSTPRKQE